MSFYIHFESDLVIVDDYPLTFPVSDGTYRAVSWNGTAGQGELLNGSQASFSDPSPWDSIIAEHAARKSVILDPPLPPFKSYAVDPIPVVSDDTTPTRIIMEIDIDETTLADIVFTITAAASIGRRVWKFWGALERGAGVPVGVGGVPTQWANSPKNSVSSTLAAGVAPSFSFAGNKMVVTGNRPGSTGVSVVWVLHAEILAFNPNTTLAILSQGV